MPKYNPERDIPDLTGKVVLVTGGNFGIGLSTTLNLAQHNPKHIYLASRSASKASAALSTISRASPDIPVTFLPLDLSSFTSIRSCARTFLTHESTLHILICSAGILGVPPALTQDGYEIQFGTNFLGHALLTRLLLPALKAAANLPETAQGDVRIVNVSSAAAYAFPPPGGIIFDSLSSPCETLGLVSPRWTCYAQSKLAQVLYTQELARRLDLDESGIKAVSVHPGRVVEGSSLSDQMPTYELVTLLDALSRPFLRVSAEQGSWNVLWAATAPGERVVAGNFYFPVGTIPFMGPIRNEALAGRLWEWTDKELEGQGLEDRK